VPVAANSRSRRNHGGQLPGNHGFPCGTFSQAELTADRVITRYHPVLSVPVVTIRGMAGDQETVTTAATVTARGDLVPRAGTRLPGPAAIAAELLARTRAELPVLAGLGAREELLTAAWLASLRAARTRRAPTPPTCAGGWGG
jgi:hypothetical protein